ncbi:MAG TPA: IS1595 family transposase [Pseudolabrys sp.]|nr:IS1595 family transposase [Pseudolabrys sp.]
MSMLSKKYFKDEKAAFRHLEGLLWENGRVCPHCGTVDRSGALEGVKDKKGRTRLGLYKCYECRKQFTVRVGTVFESAHIPLHKCLQAVYLMTSSKKGISAHQLHRTLEITYKSAWFLCHRIREAMRPKEFTPMGGAGKRVEVDETYFGHLKGANSKTVRWASQHRNVVLTLVERSGSARSFHIDGTTMATLGPILRTNLNRESHLMTDSASWYKSIGKEYAAHGVVDHAHHEYIRGENYTNTVEGYFSIFKRGMKGVYQHCAEKHLHRYLSEFDFRYNNRVALGVNDEARADRAVKGIVGKRLTYRWPNEAESQTIC